MLLPSPFLELIDRGIFLDGRLILFPGAKNPENPQLFFEPSGTDSDGPKKG
jgi:hypothetical protein